MEFSKFDIVLLVTMSMAIILMSFTFPALGMTTEDPENRSSVPRYNDTIALDDVTWDISGDFPNDPGAPALVTITWLENDSGSPENYVWLEGDSDSGIQLTILNVGNVTHPDVKVNLNNVSSGTVIGQDSEDVTGEGQTFRFDNHSYVITNEVTKYDNVNQSNFTVEVEATLNEQPEGTSWLDRIPIVGTVYGAAEATASVLVWIGALIRWAIGSFIEILILSNVTTVNVIAYMTDLIIWLISTYNGIISAAPSYAAVIIMVPAIALFLEFAKLFMIFISLLPTT